MSVFLDTNIIIYAVGKEHPYKAKCQEICLKTAREEIKAVTSVEVLQEVLYRYWSIGRLEDGLKAVSKTQTIVQKVLGVTNKDFNKSLEFLRKYPKLPPRDALHLAVMFHGGFTQVISTDKHFDQVSEVERVDPRSV